MKRSLAILCSVPLIVAAIGCSKPAGEAAKSARPKDKIQGKAEVGVASNPADSALNAGGPSVYLSEGVRRYSLFFKKTTKMENGKEYLVEGVYAQKAIDEIGDPEQGKSGYPIAGVCERVVGMAWPGQAFDVADGQTSALRARIKRYPARPVFLVTKVEPVTDDSLKTKKVSDESDAPEVTVDAEKQKALLTEGPTVLPAPLWKPEGGAARCKLIIDENGKVDSLETGAQLCEAVPWDKFNYKPRVEKGKPVRVKTEVEVKFEPLK